MCISYENRVNLHFFILWVNTDVKGNDIYQLSIVKHVATKAIITYSNVIPIMNPDNRHKLHFYYTI